MNLKQKLEYHYKAFDISRISPDPLQFLHLFSKEEDIELMGFIASVFAYGNVRQIINTLDKILLISNSKPYDFVINFKKEQNKIKLIGLKHRFYTDEDIQIFFSSLSNFYNKRGIAQKFVP